jgi:hypothetical protein
MEEPAYVSPILANLVLISALRTHCHQYEKLEEEASDEEEFMPF